MNTNDRKRLTSQAVIAQGWVCACGCGVRITAVGDQLAEPGYRRAHLKIEPDVGPVAYAPACARRRSDS